MRLLFTWPLMFLIMIAEPAAAACGGKRYCRQMRTCAEARYHFEVCGLRRLDGDHDGIPCERLCGRTRAAYEHNSRASRTPTYLEPSSSNAVPLMPSASGTPAFTCGGKRYCREMSSCEEAIFYLQRCGLKRLDGNGDGIPCNRLCR